MPRDLFTHVPGRGALGAPTRHVCLTRREFLVLSAASGAAMSLGCGGARDITKPLAESSTIVGDVVDLLGTPQAGLGTIYLMYENGLQTGRSSSVDAAGRFSFTNVPPGAWQVRFYAPGVAYVPEEAANPVRVTLTNGQTASVRFAIERGWEDGAPMVEIYIGDDFFQEQPLGAPNAETVVKIGTPICWYNVGLMEHTTTGGFWNSGPMRRTDSFIWVPDRTGVFPYTCAFHKTQMIASLRVPA
jgi:plastocyanin